MFFTLALEIITIIIYSQLRKLKAYVYKQPHFVVKRVKNVNKQLISNTVCFQTCDSDLLKSG